MPLAPRVARLVAVEIDRDLAAHLAARLPAARPRRRSATSSTSISRRCCRASAAGPRRRQPALQRRLADPVQAASTRPAGGAALRDATVMLQKEVADRLRGEPRVAATTASLAIQVALHADVDAVLTLPPGAFRPPPKVTSAVVVCASGRRRWTSGRRTRFERIVRGTFLQRRKTLLNALQPGRRIAAAGSRRMLIARAGLDPRSAPEGSDASPTSRRWRGLCYSFAPKSLTLPGFRAFPVARPGGAARPARTAAPGPARVPARGS